MINVDLLKSDRCIGKKIKNGPRKSNNSHLKDLKAVKEQLALFASLSAGSVKKIEYCRRNGLKERSLNLLTSLHFAAEGPNLELVKLAIKFNLDVKVTYASLQTALHIASAHGRLDTVQYLVEEMKMEGNVWDRDGKTALPSQKGHLHIVTFLLKHEADATSRDVFGYAPIHYAVEENLIDNVAIFLEREPNVEENQTSSGL
ncbi:hypothetical protein AVEN_177899-1 [Araneus ventricosus]|uniref:Alpha-latrotoxin n=1 Tax=Araneus ventricosus TaxID=182803 RepID=A0A4Y2KCF6_ARAVE|nr:hypothetical protein AVEN_177899-1 [Araneus ventricosus]